MDGKLRAVFLISATGGGHFAAADALAAGIEACFPGRFEFVYVDAFREHCGFPLRKAPEIYARWVALMPRSYGLAFSITDALYRSRFFLDGFQRRLGRRMIAALSDVKPDIVLPIHALLVRPAVSGRNALGCGIPIVTVVTDFARPHQGWFHPGLDLCLVPGEEARRRAHKAGISSEKILETGLLVHPKFASLGLSKTEARKALGLEAELPTVLLLGGGEGMGRLGQVARELDHVLTWTQLLVVCGRNQGLAERLSRVAWRNSVRIFGFVRELEVLMRAADLLVTKAGPLTIAEAITVGLPMLIYDAIPVQETGNALWVEREGVGRFVRDSRRLARLAAEWLSSPAALQELSGRARALAVPDSALRAAAAIGRLLGLGR